MGIKLRFWIVIVLLAVPISSAIMTINPQKYEIKDIEFNKTYNIVLTAINPDSSIFDVKSMLNKDSGYLSDYVKIDPMQFRLQPNDKKNIRLSLTVPNTLSPEEHILNIDFVSAEHDLGKFRLSFTVPGEKIENLVLEKASASDASDQDLIYFDLELNNKGNVIARGSPIVEIYHNGQSIASLGKESSIMIMPGQRYNISLMYDTSNIQPGIYSFNASFSYNGLETASKEGNFTVMNKDKDDSYYEIKKINPGEPLKLTIALENPTEKLSFYSIEYNLFEQGIGDTVEGEMQSSEKQVELNIDTSELQPGSYDLDLVIKTGRNLENIEERKIMVQVSSKKSLVLPGIALLLAFFGVAIYVARPYMSNRKAKKAAYLQYEISSLGRKFASTEQSLQQMTQEINKFIHASNEWLRSKGYGDHGFR